MSVSNVTVFDYNTTAPIKAADIKPGSELRIEVDGFTSLAKVPVAGTWRIYDMVRSCPGDIASHTPLPCVSQLFLQRGMLSVMRSPVPMAWNTLITRSPSSLSHPS
jgi:hypothetical protein